MGEGDPYDVGLAPGGGAIPIPGEPANCCGGAAAGAGAAKLVAKGSCEADKGSKGFAILNFFFSSNCE